MKTSQFAEIYVIAPAGVTDGKTAPNTVMKKVGMAQSLRIEDNFGSKPENVIGNPLPIIHPGFIQITVSMEKATIDSNLKSIGFFNPLLAHVGSSYNYKYLPQINELDASLIDLSGDEAKMMPFMFVLLVRDTLAADVNKNVKKGVNGNNPVGAYACVLSNSSIALSSQNAIIMENLTAYARPIAGGWFTEEIKKAFANDKNGMQHVINSIIHGYYS